MLVRLDPPLPVLADGLPAMAHAWLDYGPDYDLYWLVASDDTRQFWCLNNKRIRAVDNITLGRNPMANENPTINGAQPCGESKQVDSAKTQPTRPTPSDGSGPRNPRNGGL